MPTSAPAVLGISWLVGTVPVAQLAARASRGVDLRSIGSGTVSGTALFEVAGFGPLALAGLAELAKGAAGPLLAGPARGRLGALAAACAVVGHDWSPWLAFRGGRGVSLAIGASLACWPPAAACLAGGLVAGRLVRQSGAGTLAGLLALPLAARGRGGPGSSWAAVVVAPVLLKRLLGNEGKLPATRRALVGRLVADRDDWMDRPRPCSPAARQRRR